MTNNKHNRNQTAGKRRKRKHHTRKHKKRRARKGGSALAATNTKTHLVCSGCSAPTRERTIQCKGKAHKLRPGWRFFCKKCWPEHVCGEAKHSRASSKRPGVSASNRTRAEEGAGSDSD